MFSALAFVISLLEFSIFPATNFLKLDFSWVFILLAGFICGPISGIICCAIKELLRFLIYSQTGGIGELANFIVCVGFIIIPSVVYLYRKGIKVVIISLIIGAVVEICLALLSNRFVLFPLYMKDSAKEVFNSVWYYIVLFNMIKTVVISLITFFVYKRISNLLHKI